jgi:DNA-binding MarR family transcriptional regulator
MPPNRTALVAQLSAALADLQAVYDDRDQALADALGVNRTDLRCLDLIVREGPQTASQLGARLHLTRGSMTTLVDRLERAGYARRHDDPQHGRRKLVVPTVKLVETITPLLDPARVHGETRLAKYDDAELALILDFLRTTHAAQDAVVETIRGSR